jgi:GNAT superfamily N-acetyltransferase
MAVEEAWVTNRYTADDAAECLELTRRTLGEAEAAVPPYYEWLGRPGPAGAAIVVLAREKKTGRLIGQAATVPVRLRLSGKLRIAGLLLEPVVDPSHQKRDVAADLLADICARSAEEGVALTYAMPSQTVYWALVNRAGFTNVGAVPLLVCPFDPERLAIKATGSRALARTASLARRVWRLPPPAVRQVALPGLQVAEVDAFDGAFAAFWDRVQHRFPVIVVRDPAYLEWRFAAAPVEGCRTFAARSEGEVRAFAVLRVGPLGRFSAGLIEDLVVESTAEGRAAGRLLIDHARSYFEERDVDIIAALAPRHTDEFRLLRSRGFWVCPKFLEPRPFRLLVRCHDEESSPSRLALELRNWFVTLGDHDLA